VIAGLALLFAMVVLVQSPADAAPSGSVAAAVAGPSIGDGNAQINIGQFACPILLAVRNAFASSPFFSFVVAALQPFLVLFGCVPSG
jgi:hypothetical protein